MHARQVRPRFWLLLTLTAALVFSISFLVTRAGSTPPAPRWRA